MPSTPPGEIPASIRPFGVSVIVPTFNRAELLLRAIESVTCSRPELVEIVVVDDGSDIDPRTLLPPANRSGVPLRTYRFERNCGPQAARNLGIRRARFSHIAFLDSDDAFAATKLDVVLGELEKQASDILIHAVTGMPKANRLGKFWNRRLKTFIPFHWWAVLYNPAATPGLVIRRRARLGLPRMRHSEDWFYLLRYALPDERVQYLEEELASVFRAQGAAGGLSGASWRMRRGEFGARSILLRKPTPDSLVRYLLGTLVGLLRVCNDTVRGRYWR